jgi:hypothetical protein
VQAPRDASPRRAWLRRFLLLSLAAVAAFAALVACGKAPSGARTGPTRTVTRAPADRLGAFDQLNTTRRSRLSVDRRRRLAGAASLRARLAPDPGARNSFARAILDLRWRAGDDVRYGAWFYLPPGFKHAMQGEVDLMRWDNFPTYPRVAPDIYAQTARREDIGGVVLFHGDHALHLIAGTPTTFVSLLGGYPISEGRWHRIEVHQRFDPDAPLSELFLDGRLLGRTTQRGFDRLPIDRLRFGLVGIGAGTQTNGLTLWFGGVRVTVAR